MDPTDPFFSKLPGEILLLILKPVPDVPPLRQLDKASPTVSSLFDECGPEIIESIVSSSLPEQIQSLIRTVVLIQSESIPSRSLDEFTAVFLRRDGYCMHFVNAPDWTHCIRRIHPSLKDSFDACESCREAFTPIEIPKNISQSILRNIMNRACQIQKLTQDLLQYSRDRCLALQPLQLDQKFHYIPRPNTDRAPQRRPFGKSFKPESSDTFSWIER